MLANRASLSNPFDSAMLRVSGYSGSTRFQCNKGRYAEPATVWVVIRTSLIRLIFLSTLECVWARQCVGDISRRRLFSLHVVRICPA
jgi:hypothetical protein